MALQGFAAAFGAPRNPQPSVARVAMNSGRSVWDYLSNGGKILIPAYYVGATWDATGELNAMILLAPEMCAPGVTVRISDPSVNFTCQCPQEVACAGCKSTTGREAWYDEGGLVLEVANVCPQATCYAAWRKQKIAQANEAGVAAAKAARDARGTGRPARRSDAVLNRASRQSARAEADAAAVAGEPPDIEDLIAATLAGYNASKAESG